MRQCVDVNYLDFSKAFYRVSQLVRGRFARQLFVPSCQELLIDSYFSRILKHTGYLLDILT